MCLYLKYRSHRFPVTFLYVLNVLDFVYVYIYILNLYIYKFYIFLIIWGRRVEPRLDITNIENKYKHDIAFLPKQNVRCHGRRNVLP